MCFIHKSNQQHKFVFAQKSVRFTLHKNRFGKGVCMCLLANLCTNGLDQIRLDWIISYSVVCINNLVFMHAFQTDTFFFFIK